MKVILMGTLRKENMSREFVHKLFKMRPVVKGIILL